MPSTVLATLTQAGTGQHRWPLWVEVRVGVGMNRQLQPCMVIGTGYIIAGSGKEKANQGRLQRGGGI